MSIEDSEKLALPPPWNMVFTFLTRVFVWGLIFAILYILRSFFLLIFLTFVFAYVQAHTVARLKPRIQSRPLRVVLVGLLLLGVIVGVGSFLVPRIKTQAELFSQKYGTHLQAIDTELVRLSIDYPLVDRVLPSIDAIKERYDPKGGIRNWDLRTSPAATTLQAFLGVGENTEEKPDIRETITKLRNFGATILAVSSAFLLSLLFSFLIVLDLPALSRSVVSLSDSKLRFIYLEVAGSITNFANVLGRALEAQLLIALVNTLLTLAGLYLLGISENAAFLSTVVFLCSFIPVAGVFISSIPICLLALQAGGLYLVVGSIIMITVIHLIEAYVLNPRIYGHHLRMNPVLVLIILTIAGKLFHVWGLVLGLPVCNYFFSHAIRERSAQRRRGSRA